MSALRTHAAFENNFVSILDKYAPKKTKILLGDQKLHFNKNLWKQIMTFFSDNKTCWQIWINKPNCSNLRNFTADYNSKPFWKSCKPYLSNRNSYIKENIMLLENHKLLSKQKDVTAIFNKHSGSIRDSLNLFSWPEDTSVSSTNDTVNSFSEKFAFHRSIKAIKKKKSSKFSFNHVSTETIKRIMNENV